MNTHQEIIDTYNELARANYFYTVDHKDATLAKETLASKKVVVDLIKSLGIKYNERLIEQSGRERLYQLELK